VPVNTRLTPNEAEYILTHSGARLLLVDHEYAHLVPASFVRTHGASSVVVSKDTGRAGDPYEDFLSSGRAFSHERGWMGLPAEADEDAGSSLCYT
jgi:long-subunit acyl-CoA synthetase (AMP-forming)